MPIFFVCDMNETQNIEYKQQWIDEYLKWICGFANAQGGKLFIGMDDNGEIVGIDDYQIDGRHSQQSR